MHFRKNELLLDLAKGAAERMPIPLHDLVMAAAKEDDGTELSDVIQQWEADDFAEAIVRHHFLPTINRKR